MKIHQFLTSFSYGDAIGNETLAIRDCLREHGFESDVFAYEYHPRFAGQIYDYRTYARQANKDNIVIYHFSIGSPVSEAFLALPDRKFMIYHNITPYEFFIDFHTILARDCYKGRQELKRYAPLVELALGDSEYNRQELVAAGFANTGVLPLVIDFSAFKRPILPVFQALYGEGKTNIIYVGRIIPNKKIDDIIRIFACYQRYFNPSARLFLVGEYRGFERYLTALYDLVQRLQVRNVIFTGHIRFDEVVSYFKLAHAYMHMSEHEGFCVPVLESFYLDIPVIAFDAGAVKETMHGGGVCVERKELLPIAALLDRLITDNDLKKRILESQRRVIAERQKMHSGQILLDFLRQHGTESA